MVYRFTSPMLEGDDATHECPVGYVLRTTPYVYQAIPIANWVENGSTDPMALAPWAVDAIRVVSSERARLAQNKVEQSKSKSDADYGARTRQRRG